MPIHTNLFLNLYHYRGLATLDANLNVQADIEAIDDGTGAAPNAKSFFDGNGYGPLIRRATVSAAPSQNEIKLTGITSGPATTLLDAFFVIRDDGNPSRSVRYAKVIDYHNSTDTFTLTHLGGTAFTIGANDIVDILPTQ